MANLNKVLLIGNLTRDPELRYTPGGTAVAEFGLAVNRQWRNQSGETQEDTTFVDVVVWGRQGENVNQYLSKGRPVFVEGRLQYDAWENKEGQKRSRLRVVAERVQFLGGRSDSGSPGPQTRSSGRSAGTREPAVQEGPPDEQVNFDDVPF